MSDKHDKRPKCKNCGGHHWLSEPHVSNVTEAKTEGIPEPKVTLRPSVKQSNVTEPCIGCTQKQAEIDRLRQELVRLKGQNAERQRAYRDRQVH